MNNYEKIKQMSIEEMITFMRNANCYTTCAYQKECQGDKNCNEGIKEWLKSEVENGSNRRN